MKAKRIIISVLYILFLAVFLISGYKLISYYTERKEATDLYREFINTAIKTPTPQNTEEEKESLITVDFDSLKKDNKDIIGWIHSPDTVINYPVVKGEDNDQYLHQLPNGKYNIAGSIFADYRNSEIGKDSNLIIYGHHMKNDSMFGTLLNYSSQEYYDAHPIIYFFTPQKKYKIELISAFVTKADSDVYNINRTEDELKEYMDEISRKSTFNTNAEYKNGDTIVTLSTCTNVSEEDRFVLIGLLRETE